MPDFQEKRFKAAKIRLGHVTADIFMLELEGEFDHAVFVETSDYLGNLFCDRECAVVVDMHNLTFMDSSGVKLLTSLAKSFGFENVAVYKANHDLMRIISLVALDKKLCILDNQDDLDRWSGLREAA